MKFKWSQLFRLDGELGRAHYVLLGLCLMSIKFGIDRGVALYGFGRSWTVYDYLPASQSAMTQLTGQVAPFYSTMLAVSIPFVWIGVALTLQRLRSSRLPLWLVFLFFFPLLNLLFFVVLGVLPERTLNSVTAPPQSGPAKGVLDRLLPTSMLGSACVSILIAVVFGVVMMLLSAKGFRDYGLGLFVGVPFVLGLSSSLLFGYHGRRTLRSCLGVANLSIAICGIMILAFAWEGLICLLMAAPLASLLASIGGVLGFSIQDSYWRRQVGPRVVCVLALIIPIFMSFEATNPGPAPQLRVRTSLEIDAPPDVVWKNVVTFSHLPPPTELLFQIGIAYPIRAEIKGTGVGAVRECIFSTGPFIEPIEVWDEPRLLKFSVTHNPPPMEEWTPYRHVKPPHLEGFLASDGGQFRLLALPNNRTRLEGTTWYKHHMNPAGYWQLWSDGIIHQIHLRVLRHIKQLSEKSSGTRSTAAAN